MAKVLVSDQYLEDIADAIRGINGQQTSYTPAQMAPAISALSSIIFDGSVYQDQDGYLVIGSTSGGGGSVINPNNLQNKTVTPATSQQVITADSGYDALGSVTVNAINLQSKSVTPTESTTVITASSGYQGLSSVTVNAISTTYVGSQVVLQDYYTGSTTPTSALGSVGDLYFQTA